MIELEWVEEIDSTSSELMRRAEAGALPLVPVALAARRQTGARGRLGRRWEVIGGNLFLSVLLRIGDLRQAGHWSLLAGVALVEALGGADLGLGLKWPNDVMARGGKLAGILIEALPREGGVALVIGYGVNIVGAPQGLGRPVTCLAELGARGDAHAVAVAVLKRLAAWAQRYAVEGFDPVRDAWLQAGHDRGEALSVQHGRDRLEGRFAGLAADGALLLDVDGRVVTVAGGEVIRQGGRDG